MFACVYALAARLTITYVPFFKLILPLVTQSSTYTKSRGDIPAGQRSCRSVSDGRASKSDRANLSAHAHNIAAHPHPHRARMLEHLIVVLKVSTSLEPVPKYCKFT